jgi:membrane fusion protein (multidrug efflux system)
MRRLHRDRAVSQKEHDDALSAFERAEANLKVAQGSLHEAEINLGYTEVKAPISGIVRKEEQSVGNLVSSNGQPSSLTTMVQISPLHVIFSVSGTLWSCIVKSHDAGKIKLQKFDDFKVEIIMSDGSIYQQMGKIIFVDSSEDDMTSGVSIKAEVPNDENQKFLLPGQFVRVRLIGAEYKDVVVVPQSALISTKMGSMVYVVKEDKTVEARPVKAELAENQAIVHDGLKEGEIVISEGIVKARPGQLVNARMK